MAGYINDPIELALPPQTFDEVVDEEPRDYHEFFGDDIPEDEVGKYAGYPEMLYTEVTCKFNSKGEHIYMSDNCPHFDMEDQEGRRVREGWTVQVGYH